jgi:hypothetical protein
MGIIPENQYFLGGEKFILIQISLFMWYVKKHVCLEKKHSSMLHILSLWELSYFFKAVFLHLKCFNLEIGPVSSKEAYSAEFEKLIYLPKDNDLC